MLQRNKLKSVELCYILNKDEYPYRGKFKTIWLDGGPHIQVAGFDCFVILKDSYEKIKQSINGH